MLPAGSLKDRVAIITGGGTGLGFAMAKEFARLGAKLVLTSRDPKHIEPACEEIRGMGGAALAVTCDVRNPDQVDAMVAAAIAKFGRLDLLVNNAAGNFICPAENLTVNGWNAVIGIVLNGTFFCSRAAGKWWIDNGHPGRILNIVSTYAWTGGPGTVHSAAAKAGVVAMTRSLAIEWSRYGVRVNAVAPGPFEGTGAAKQLWMSPEIAEKLREQIPVKRFGRPEELAQLCSYLVSDYADFSNGAVVEFDAGMWLNRGIYQDLGS